MFSSAGRAASSAGRAAGASFAARSSLRSVHATALRLGPPALSETFLSGASANYIEEMYAAWSEDPVSVHSSWGAYFSGVADGAPAGAAHADVPAEGTPLPVAGGGAASPKAIQEAMSIQSLVRAYQRVGHNVADLDPLGILEADLDGTIPPELDPQFHGFTDADMDREFSVPKDSLVAASGKLTLRKLMETLEATYTNKIGCEYMHLPTFEQINWIRERVEAYPQFREEAATKKLTLDRLMEATIFEQFLATKYPNDKRFGLEGGESLIPGIKAAIDTSVDLGCEKIVLGMPHRGRLNVLGNVMRKPMEMLFNEFDGAGMDDREGSGDVKYHLGTSFDRKTQSGKNVHLSLVANPSHLETVDPVVEGKTRATQNQIGGEQRFDKAMSILLHGDAAFAGQGVIYETFGFSELPAYSTGGTIHIICNNQIGFTTDPRMSRSTPYCCDIGKAYGAPIFHVNGDDPDAVVFVCNLAAEWRQTFHKDVIVDIVCYRRHGHNELDNPMFTQPLMYSHIGKHPITLDLYKKQLISEGAIDEAFYAEQDKRITDTYEEAFIAGKSYQFKTGDWLESKWAGFLKPAQLARIQTTGIAVDELRNIGNASASVPEEFTLHRALKRILKARSDTVEAGEGIDFATAEAMAFGSLLREGNHVRLSGQDVERGTFSHRHALLHDQENESTYTPLNHLSDDQAEFSISNSHLSEYAVLGFETGYSLSSPNQLVMWEAQFGDFANTAQCVIDQYISSGEQKWLRQSGLVMLLPHGYEGMGPEHSSARLERFLQMCDEDADTFPATFSDAGATSDQRQEEVQRQIQLANWQVVNCTTTANYFHVLRRQVHREFRKPLIAMTGKFLLRYPPACSSIDEMAPGTRFKRCIGEIESDSLVPPDDIKNLIVCSGKVYYDLVRARELNEIDDVAIIRVEQLAPFPFDHIKEQVEKYPNAAVTWCQEEHKNQGPWSYVQPRIETALRHSSTHATERPRYTGRDSAAATATGNKYQHIKELQEFLLDALVGEEREIDMVDKNIPKWK